MSLRLAVFDILKGIGILLVVVGHTFMREIGPFILSFHMPLFFIVSGYFFRPVAVQPQIRKDFRRLVVPYLFVTMAVMLLAAVQKYHAMHEVDFFWDTLYHNGTPAWFLLALFGAKTLFNIIYRCFPQHYMTMAFGLSSVPCLLARWYDIPTYLSLGSAVCGVFFVAVGCYSREHDLLAKAERCKPVVVVIALVSWLVTSTIGVVDLHYCTFKLWAIDFLGACGGTYLCYVLSQQVERYSAKLGSWLSWCGYYSFVIYSFHTIEYVFPHWHQIASFAGTACRAYVILALRLLFAWMAVLVTMRLPFLKVLFFPQAAATKRVEKSRVA
jgi:fucose 4-O-acetylase-like acetyltransferase